MQKIMFPFILEFYETAHYLSKFSQEIAMEITFKLEEDNFWVTKMDNVESFSNKPF